MNNFDTFLKRLKDLRLSANEHLALRERLALYADQHPPLPANLIPSPFTRLYALFASGRSPVYALALAFLVVVSGGVALAAEGSVPGESLYAIKVHVNEPVMVALAATPRGQAARTKS